MEHHGARPGEKPHRKDGGAHQGIDTLEEGGVQLTTRLGKAGEGLGELNTYQKPLFSVHNEEEAEEYI